ncbi:MAG: ABC transporter permease [Calditrichia bacterium]
MIELFKISFLNIKGRWIKSLFLFLVYLLLITFTVSTIKFSRSLEATADYNMVDLGANILIIPNSESLQLHYKGLQFGSVQVTEKGLTLQDTAQILRIKNKKNIKFISPKLIKMTKLNEMNVLVSGIDFSNEIKLKKWWNIIGTIPTRNNEVLIGSKIGKEAQVRISDTILVRGEPFIVTGQLEETGDEDDQVVFMDLATMQKLFNAQKELSLIEVAALCYDCPIDTLVSQISEKIQNGKAIALKQIIKTRMKSIALIKHISLILIISFILVVSIMTVLSLLSAVNERKKEIGLYLTIGYSPWMLMSIFIFEIMIISLAASVFGYGSSIFILQKIGPQFFSSVIPFTFNFPELILTIISIVLLSILIGAIPAVKAIRIEPLAAMKSY